MAFRKTSVCDVFEDEPLTPEIQINDYRKKLIADPYFWVQGSPKSKRKSNTLVAKDNSKSQLQNGIFQLSFFHVTTYNICTYISTHTGSLSVFLNNKTKLDQNAQKDFM